MGDFPMMTDRGTFIINGTERIVVSQLVRSPGVYFGVNADKTSPEKEIVDAKMIPSRGAWLEFEVDKKDVVYVRIDRKRKQPVTVLLKALGFGETDEELLNLIIDEQGRPYESMRNTLEKDHTDERRRGVHRHLPQAAPGRTAHARLRACAAREPLLQPEALRPWRRSAATRCRRSCRKEYPLLGLKRFDLTIPDANVEGRSGDFTLTEGRHPRDRLVPREAAQPRRRLLPRRHRPLRQPPGAHGRRADPEPAPCRPQPYGARRARAHDDPGRRGDHAADAHQHPARWSRRSRSSSVRRSSRSSWTRRTRSRASPTSGASRRSDRVVCRVSVPGFEVRDVHPSHYGRMCPIETPEGPNIGLIGYLVELRADQPVRLHRDAVPQGREGPGHRRDRVPRRRRRGRVRHRPGERPRRRAGQLPRRARARACRVGARSTSSHPTRSTTWTCRRSRSSRSRPR